MTDEELAELRANMAALWQAAIEINANVRTLHANYVRLSHRLMLQEAATAVEELDQPRRAH